MPRTGEEPKGTRPIVKIRAEVHHCCNLLFSAIKSNGEFPEISIECSSEGSLKRWDGILAGPG